METVQIMQEIYHIQNRLGNAMKELFKYGKQKAESETEFRKELSKEILRLKSEGLSAGLIKDVATGNISDLLLQREISDSLFQSCKESIRALETQISALQSIAKYSSEVNYESK